MISSRQLGERLAEARKRRGLNQADVAERLGIARTTFTAMEKGDRRPSSAELVRLGEILQVQVHEFLSRYSSRPRTASRFRIASQGSVPKEQLTAAVELLESLGARYLKLEQLNNVHRVPAPLELTETYHAQAGTGSQDRELARLSGESAALMVRSALGLSDMPATNLDEKLERLAGLRIFYLSDLPSMVAALFVWSEELGPCVAVNRNLPRERQRWSLAHELGHFLRDREGGDVLMVAEFGQPMRRDNSEIFADAFAKVLLLPASGVSREFAERCQANRDKFSAADILRMAQLYEVSFQAMTLRLEELSFLKGGTYQRLIAHQFRPEKAKKELDLEQRGSRGILERFPAQYVRLALEAFGAERISEGELAELLDTDRISARDQYLNYCQYTLSDDSSIGVDLSQKVFAPPEQ